MKGRALLPLFGVLAVALVIGSFIVIGETPDTDASASKLASFYTEHDSDLIAGGIMVAAAAAAFIAWAVQVRSLLFIAEGGSATRATLGLVGSALFAVGLTVFAGLNFSLGDIPEKLDPGALQALHVLSEDMFAPLAAGTVLTLFGFGLATLSTRALPVWLGWLCVIGAILVFTPVWFGPFILLGVFILVTSVLMAMRPAAPAAPAAPVGSTPAG
jgi:hypothetical protein